MFLIDVGSDFPEELIARCRGPRRGSICWSHRAHGQAPLPHHGRHFSAAGPPTIRGSLVGRGGESRPALRRGALMSSSRPRPRPNPRVAHKGRVPGELHSTLKAYTATTARPSASRSSCGPAPRRCSSSSWTRIGTSRRGGGGPKTGPGRDRRRASDETGESEAGGEGMCRGRSDSARRGEATR
jgi:hypothetical protein